VASRTTIGGNLLLKEFHPQSDRYGAEEYRTSGSSCQDGNIQKIPLRILRPAKKKKVSHLDEGHKLRSRNSRRYDVAPLEKR